MRATVAKKENGMDHRFDEIAKDLVGGLSRRQALARLGGGLAGMLLGSLGLDLSLIHI